MGRDALDGVEAGEGPDDEGFDAVWVVPSGLLLGAWGVRAIGDERVWRWTSLGLTVLAVAVTVGVGVAAARRRAYGALLISALGVMLVCTVTYVRGDLP